MDANTKSPAEDVSVERIVDDLVKEINDDIKQIRDNKKSPKDLGTGHKFAKLQALDLAAHRESLEEYKPVAIAFFTEARKSDTAYQRKVNEERRKAEYQIMTMSTRGMSGDASDFNNMPNAFQQRERGSLSERTKKPLPEKAAKKQKSQKFAPVTQSQFTFDGESYGKGPLVLAVVMAHAKKNKKITHEQMKAAFPDTLLRGYGIFTTAKKAEEMCKTRKRYFIREDQLVKLADEVIAVCNQFTGDNIGAFLNQAKLLGYTIK